MDKYDVTTKNKCTLMATRQAKIDFLLSYSKSLYLVKCNGELLDQCLN